MRQLNPALRWWWKYGGRLDFWAVFEQQIGQFIKENSLRALSKEGQRAIVIDSIANPIENTATVMKETTIGFPVLTCGGMKAAHLHYRDNIYILQSEQWAKFTAPILEKFKAKLEAVKTVNFRTTMNIGKALNEMV